MAKIAGVDVLLYVETGTPGTFTVLGGQKGATLNRKMETIEATSKDSGGWAESLAGLKSWSIEAEAFVVNGDVGLGKLEDAFESRTKVKVEIRIPTGNMYTGEAYITDLPMEFPQDDAVTCSVTLQGTGALTVAPAV